MKLTPLVVGFLTAGLIAGCGRDRRNNDTGTSGGGMGSDTMPSGAAPTVTDTGMPAMDTTISSDTARTGPRLRPDTNNATGKKTDRPVR